MSCATGVGMPALVSIDIPAFTAVVVGVPVIIVQVLVAIGRGVDGSLLVLPKHIDLSTSAA